MKLAVMDTGPLVAWFCQRDEHHAWARRVFSELAPGSLVCEAVMAEVCHLVARESITQGKVIESFTRGRLQPVSLTDELVPVAQLLNRYADAPMDFADACVVRLAELNEGLEVCAVDRQFSFFRKNGREAMSLLAPFVS